MNIDIKNIVLSAVQQALTTAERQAAKQRPISNISAESLCNSYFTQFEESKALGTDTEIYWLTAFIETSEDLDDCLEIEEIGKLIEEGFTEGADQNHDSPSQYAFAVSSGSSTGQRSQQKKFGSSAALRFMGELLDSVETLTGIADEHGAQTLADLMYLQEAILEDGFIDNHPDESKVLEIVQGLPSGEQWAHFIRQGED